jgi:hypothetical protein
VSARPDLGRSTDAALAAVRPISPAAALSRDPVELPELPVFRGPGWSALSAIRWAVPLLVGGGFYSLAIHGQLSWLSLGIGLGVGISGVAAAHATLLSRRRRLLAAARALAIYAERTRSREHELSRRARFWGKLLGDGWKTADARVANDVEQGLHYTRELLRSGK